MKYLIAAALVLAATSAHAEDFAAERALCSRHLNFTPRMGIRTPTTHYATEFDAICTAMDARETAANNAAKAAQEAADLNALQGLITAPAPAATPTPVATPSPTPTASPSPAAQ